MLKGWKTRFIFMKIRIKKGSWAQVVEYLPNLEFELQYHHQKRKKVLLSSITVNIIEMLENLIFKEK
jgi:CRISPR/Cas system CSM-associated protein Csm2 small subunit